MEYVGTDEQVCGVTETKSRWISAANVVTKSVASQALELVKQNRGVKYEKELI